VRRGQWLVVVWVIAGRLRSPEGARSLTMKDDQGMKILR
jgi:hypothetical protein